MPGQPSFQYLLCLLEEPTTGVFLIDDVIKYPLSQISVTHPPTVSGNCSQLSSVAEQGIKNKEIVASLATSDSDSLASASD